MYTLFQYTETALLRLICNIDAPSPVNLVSQEVFGRRRRRSGSRAPRRTRYALSRRNRAHHTQAPLQRVPLPTTTMSAKQDKATTERHARTLRELLKRPENKACADCKRNGMAAFYSS